MKTENKSQLYSRRAFLAARRAALVDSQKQKIKVIPDTNMLKIMVVGLITLIVVSVTYYSWSQRVEPEIPAVNRAVVVNKKLAKTEEENKLTFEESTKLVVYVTGAVKNPKVLHLPNGARIADAINKAGGTLPEADLESLNLAKKLSDGEQIRVHKKGETGRGGNGKNLVSINNAECAELEKLSGVGPALAQRIVDYRQKHGGFSNLEELQKVPGIGPQKFATLREQLQL